MDGPLKLRFNRYITKYKSKISLEEFVDLDDKIKFNTQEFQLYQNDPSHQHKIRRRFHNATDSIMDFHRTLRDF